MTKSIALLLFPDVEVLDFAGPFEVLSVANEIDGCKQFDLSIIAADAAPVRARNGLKIVPDHTLASCPPIDILIIPGGFGTRALLTQPTIIDWVRQRAATAEVVFSICTGSLVLAQAGLLDGLTITTHHSALDRLAKLAPRSIIDSSQRFHDNGKFITAAGISAGIDAALHLAARLFSDEVVAKTLIEMEYTRQK
jgi:transcriptional regulator GlxA family with amidase domain